MKHLILLIVLAMLAYFGWHCTPNRTKFFVKEFLMRHALAVIAIWFGLWVGLFFAAHNGSINIL